MNGLFYSLNASGYNNINYKLSTSVFQDRPGLQWYKVHIPILCFMTISQIKEP